VTRNLPARLALTGLALALAPAATLADRLHLDGGGVIETHAWRIEGDTLHYETEVGTIGLPRSLVLRIEKTDPPPAGARVETEAPGSPAPERAPEPHTRQQDPSGTIRVPRELVQLLREAKIALESGDAETAASLYERALAKSEADFHIPRIGYALSQIALPISRWYTL